MTWFWRYLLGYVTVRISGLSLEKMLNLIGVEGIRIWGVKRPSHTVMTAKVGKGRLEALLDAASRGRRRWRFWAGGASLIFGRIF